MTKRAVIIGLLFSALLGSATYEFALGHLPWPTPDKPSWVFTKRELPVAHPSIELTRDTPAAWAAARPADGPRRLWLMGGGKLAAAVVGTTAPCVLTSRADSEESKFLSIAMGCRLA